MPLSLTLLNLILLVGDGSCEVRQYKTSTKFNISCKLAPSRSYFSASGVYACTIASSSFYPGIVSLDDDLLVRTHRFRFTSAISYSAQFLKLYNTTSNQCITLFRALISIVLAVNKLGEMIREVRSQTWLCANISYQIRTYEYFYHISLIATNADYLVSS
jgi:hypothetical protein